MLARGSRRDRQSKKADSIRRQRQNDTVRRANSSVTLNQITKLISTRKESPKKPKPKPPKSMFVWLYLLIIVTSLEKMV